MGGDETQLAGSSTLSPSGTFYDLDACFNLCWNNAACQYFVWTHGTTTGSQCESPWTNGQYTYGFQSQTFVGLCSMYGVYSNLNGAYVHTALQCRDNTYQHFHRIA
jgi:hypothetical protein